MRVILKMKWPIYLVTAGSCLLISSCTDENLLDPNPDIPTPTPPAKPTAAAADVVAPVPTATPTPIPTPTPTYRESHYEEFRRKLRLETQANATRIGEELEKTQPRINIGDTAVIRTRGGLQVEGRLQFIVEGDVMIATSSGSRNFPADDLDAYTRIRIDGGFRKEMINVEAAYEAFYKLNEEFDLTEFDLENTLSVEERAKMGQPEPLLEQAKKALEAGRRPEAFHLNRILAHYGHAPAKRDLGLFYFQGEVVERDLRQGEALLSDAAEQGDPRAIELKAELQRRLQQMQSQAQVQKDSSPKYKTVYVSVTCPHCDGKGYRTTKFSNKNGEVRKLPCQCGGTGKIRVPRNVKIN